MTCRRAKRGRPRKPKPMHTDPITFSLDAPIASTSVMLHDNALESDSDIAAKKRRLSKARKPVYHDAANLQFHQFTEEEVSPKSFAVFADIYFIIRMPDWRMYFKITSRPMSKKNTYPGTPSLLVSVCPLLLLMIASIDGV